MKFVRADCLGGGRSGLDYEYLDEGWDLYQEQVPEDRISVKVPGNVRLALKEANRISDPFIGKNNERQKWISNCVWEYTNQLDLKPWLEKISHAHPRGGIFHLTFDAIDYDASFYVDNLKVCRQTGMFSPVDLITGVTQSEMKWGPDLSPLPINLKFHIQPFWRQHAVKSQMAFGWDFAPEIRTIGIWKHIRAYHTGQLFFTEAYVHFKHPQKKDTHIILNANIKALNPLNCKDLQGEQRATLQVTFPDNSNPPREIPIRFISGQLIHVDLGKANIPPWYPWSLGKPNSTSIQLDLLTGNDLSDQFRGKIVKRKVEWARNPGTIQGHENWTLKINGTKIFLRGINWVPPDSLYGRLNKPRYKKLVDYAKSMNIDMLRVWGGGIEEKKEFYDYCDEVGMLVWQEFPFACTNYPDDPKYLQIVKKECEGIVRRTRGHPSVVTYCGGNEFNPIINKHIIDTVRTAVKQFAPDRFCFAASPFQGDDHNWRFWGMRRQFEAFEANGIGPFQMLTEYGMQASPGTKILSDCLGKSTPRSVPLTPDIEELLKFHKADLNGLKFYARSFCKDTPDTDSLIHTSQILQAYALKYATEACRAAWPNVSGVFPWQLSDPWPNISWSVIDYSLQPKLAFKMLQISYAPVLPMIRNWKRARKDPHYKKGDLIVHNATQTSFKGMLKVTIRDKSAPEKPLIFEKSYNITLPHSTVVRIDTLKVSRKSGTVIHMKLCDPKRKTVVDNVCFPAMERIPRKYMRLYDRMDARFDGWWRKHMTHFMFLDKIQEEVPLWKKKKQEFLKSMDKNSN